MTAPQPRLRAALDEQWDTIARAVSKGLDITEAANKSSIQLLSRLLVVDSSATPAGEGDPQLHEHELTLSRGQIDSINPTDLTEWARACRCNDLVRVLTALVSAVAEIAPYTADGVSQAPLHGEGSLRLVHLRGDSAIATALLEKGVVNEVLDLSGLVTQAGLVPTEGCDALVMREIGAPYVHRPVDLTLGWDAPGALGVRLVLETKWHLRRTEVVRGRAPVIALTR